MTGPVGERRLDDLTTHFLTTWSPIEVQGERPEEQRQWRSGSGGAARAGGAVGGGGTGDLPIPVNPSELKSMIKFIVFFIRVIWYIKSPVLNGAVRLKLTTSFKIDDLICQMNRMYTIYRV